MQSKVLDLRIFFFDVEVDDWSGQELIYHLTRTKKIETHERIQRTQ